MSCFEFSFPRLINTCIFTNPIALDLDLAILFAQIAAEFGRAYDHVRAGETNQPSRHLTSWYLTRAAAGGGDDAISARRRVPLPLAGQSMDDGQGYVLHGELEPSSTNEEGQARDGRRVKMMLPNPTSWAFDRSKSDRGIWVATKGGGARYKLLQPDAEAVSLDATITVGEGAGEEAAAAETADVRRTAVEATLPSQSDVHLPLRARLGLLSNLVDLLSEPFGGGDGDGDGGDGEEEANYVPIHAVRTPAAIHALLSPTPEILAQHNTSEEPLNSEPFDLELLRECPGFVRRHLAAMHPLLDGDSVFMSELEAMEAARQPSKTDSNDAGNDDDVKWSDEGYLRSAEGAEKRGRRTAWGDLISGEGEGGGSRVRPNRLIDIEIQRASEQAPEEEEAPDGGTGTNEAAEEDVPDYGHAIDYDDEEDDEDDVVAQTSKNKRPTATMRPAFDDSDDSDSDSDSDSDDDDAIVRRKKTSSNDNEAIPGVATDLDPLEYLSVPPGAEFSPEAIAAAVENMAAFLTPEPGEGDMDPSAYSSDNLPTKFAIDEGKISDFVESYVQQPTVPSLESILLASEAIRRSEKKVLKSMFKITKDHPVPSGKIVFDKWLDTAILLVKTSRDSSALVIASIMDLICDFGVIKDAKQVRLLKSKFDVDWAVCAEKARICADRNGLETALEACEKAQKHVSALMGGASTSGTVASKRPAQNSAAADVAAAMAVAAAMVPTNGAASKAASITPPTVPGKSAEAIAKEKNAKEEKDKLRRQRMAQMLKKAKLSYGASSKKSSDTTASADAAFKPTAIAEPKKEDTKRSSLPPPRSSGGWGTSDRKSESSGGGWGSSSNRTGESPATSGSGWGKPSSSAESSGGGWGQPSGSEPSSSGGGWGRPSDSKPSSSSGGGWGSSSRQESPAPPSRDGRGGDWGRSRDAPREAKGGWGTSSRPDSQEGPRSGAGGGWGAPAPPAPSSGGWGSSGGGGGGGRPDDRSRGGWSNSGRPDFDDRGGGASYNSRSQKRPREDGGWGGRGGGSRQDGPPYQETRRADDATKRRRFDAAPPAAPAPVEAPPMGRGRGRGRGAGRGKDANLPAWMTRGDAPAPPPAAQAVPPTAAPVPAMNLDVAAIADAVAMAQATAQVVVPPVAPVGAGGHSGRGRGKQANLPAWMTRGDAPAQTPVTAPPAALVAPVPAQAAVSNGPLALNQDASFKAFQADQRGFNGGGRGPGGRGGRFGPGGGAPAPSMGRGRGRGRGKDLNKPAWMTKQESM